MPKGFVDRNLTGNLERWNDGLLGFSKGTIIPVFQYSVIPESFRENMAAGIVATYQTSFILDTTVKIC